MKRLFLGISGVGLMALLPLQAIAVDDASLLGPQRTVSPAVNSTGTSSTQTGTSLQPAGSSSSNLQSADAQTGGITVPQSQTLQQTGAADQIKLLIQGEVEGEQKLEQPMDYSWLLPILAVLVVATCITGLLVLLDRRRTKQSQ
jgi:hypothetical protein